MRSSNIEIVGIGEARVLKPVVLAGETALGLLRRLIGITRGQEQRLGRLLKRRARLPAANGHRSRAPFAGLFVRGHTRL